MSPTRSRPAVLGLWIGVLWVAAGFALLRGAAAFEGAVPGIEDPRQPGLWLLLTGTLFLALIGIDLLPSGSWQRAGPILGLVVAAAAGLWSVAHFAQETKVSEVLGTETYWLDDDMMISLRYARHFAEGEGLVWNPGEYVEGYTNFLWTLMIAPFHWFTTPERVSLGVIGLTALFLVLALLFGWRLARQLGGSAAAATVAGLGLITTLPVVHWTSGGSEVLLAAFLLLWMSGRLLALPSQDVPVKRLVEIGLVGGLAVLTRPDSVVAVGVLVSWYGWRLFRQSAVQAIWLVGAALVLPLFQLAFRLTYYGEWFPNTYYLKATGWDGRSVSGVNYLVSFVGFAGPVLAFAAFAMVQKAARPIGLAVLAHFAYLVSVGGDELPQFRFVVPVIPWLWILAARGAEQLGSRSLPADESGSTPAEGDGGPIHWWEPGNPVPWGSRLAVVGLLAVAGLGSAILPGHLPDSGKVRAQSERGNVLIGELIRRNTEETAKVAHFWAGAAAYFSDRPGIDFFGKCDAKIAHLQARPGLTKPGHNKYDFDWSLGLEPDVIVGGIGADADAGFLARFRPGGPSQEYRAFAELYESPAFRSQYLANPVGKTANANPEMAEVSRKWHGIFVRQGTPLARPAPLWSP